MGLSPTKANKLEQHTTNDQIKPPEQRKTNENARALAPKQAQGGPAVALAAAAFAASSMNPFMASPMFAVPQHPAYASQYAAAALAAVAASQQQQQTQRNLMNHHQSQPPPAYLAPSQLAGCAVPSAQRLAPMGAAGLSAAPGATSQPKQQAGQRADTPTATSTSGPGTLKRSPGELDEADAWREQSGGEECDTGDSGEGGGRGRQQEVPSKRQRLEEPAASGGEQARNDGAASASPRPPAGEQAQTGGGICDRLQSVDKAESTSSSGCDVTSPTGTDHEPNSAPADKQAEADVESKQARGAELADEPEKLVNGGSRPASSPNATTPRPDGQAKATTNGKSSSQPVDGAAGGPD